MVFFQEMKRLSQISMTNKVKEHIGFDSIEILYISQNQRQIYHTQHI